MRDQENVHLAKDALVIEVLVGHLESRFPRDLGLGRAADAQVRERLEVGYLTRGRDLKAVTLSHRLAGDREGGRPAVWPDGNDDASSPTFGYVEVNVSK